MEIRNLSLRNTPRLSTLSLVCFRPHRLSGRPLVFDDALRLGAPVVNEYPVIDILKARFTFELKGLEGAGGNRHFAKVRDFRYSSYIAINLCAPWPERVIRGPGFILE